MKVIFNNRYDENIELAEVKTSSEGWEVINSFLKEHKYKAPYFRSWAVPEERKVIIDCGSHSEFFHFVFDEGEKVAHEYGM
jgi:hypothetical protein